VGSLAFKPRDAVEAARSVYFGPRAQEQARLNYIAAAVNPRRPYSAYLNQPWTQGPGGPTVEMPKDAPQVMKNLAVKSRSNFLPLVIDTFCQLMKVDGYVEANGTPSQAWDHWQANGLDARQTGIHRSALQFGASYATILPGDPAPVIKGYSPRRMTAIYQDPDIDDWPMMALDMNGPMIRLFDEQMVYRVGVETRPESGLGSSLTIPVEGAAWEFIDAQAHGFDFCPVARFRDRMLLDGEEQFGLVEPIIDIQKRIDETTFGMVVAQYYQAFKQRYVIGWIPESEREYLESASRSVWTFKDPDVKVGEVTGYDPKVYIDSKDSALADMAAIAQVPASVFGSSTSGMRNVSPEAVASNDASQDRKGSEIKTSMGETWELVLRTAALAAGDGAAATDTSSQIRWRDMTTTSPGAIVDALGKMQQMLGIPAEMLWERIPGWTDQDQKRAEELIRSGDSLDKLMVTLSKQSQPTDPQVAAGLGGR
jgi:hypothetical protein